MMSALWEDSLGSTLPRALQILEPLYRSRNVLLCRESSSAQLVPAQQKPPTKPGAEVVSLWWQRIGL
jgi:hypothetical protein